MLEFAEKRKNKEADRFIKFELHQKEKEKQLKRVYKEANLLYTDFKTA